MFENLSGKLDSIFKTLRGYGKLTPKNIEDGLRQIRLALLEADVHYKIAKTFISKIKEKALGSEVLSSLTPGQQIVKIVNESLIDLLGQNQHELYLEKVSIVSSVMLVGLQGSGKTTTAGKLALFLRKQGRNPLLVPADVYRPAAIEQLLQLGKQIGVPVFNSDPDMDPVKICKNALLYAADMNCNAILYDTAGRLHVENELMDELSRIKKAVSPSDILLVADAMTGQDAVNIAGAFNKYLDIGGVVLTKMDGDARGGAALSINAVTGTPVKFIGVGEKLSDFEIFYPERMASRILGMGDVLTFIEKAQTVVDEDKAIELEKKIKKNQFTLEDFKDQMVRIRKMGSITDIIKMIPGIGKSKQLKNLNVDEREFVKIEAIINSMTPRERKNYSIINGSRRKRIAAGSGTKVQDVNKLLKNYIQVMKMLKKVSKGGMKALGRNMLPF